MMHSCPACGSTEIISDLNMFVHSHETGMRSIFTMLYEPAPEKHPIWWSGEKLMADIRAAVCGSCGYTQLYTDKAPALLQAWQAGWQKDQPV